MSTLLSVVKNLPSGYLAFLQQANGGEGFLGSTYANLWRAEDLERFNQDYEVDEYAPGFFLIGSNGGGEAYAFDLSSQDQGLYQLPFIGMERKSAIPIADSWNAFLAPLGSHVKTVDPR